jgi:hypothetical protein
MASQAAERILHHFVIPSEEGNLSFFSRAYTRERFLASLGITKVDAFLRLARLRSVGALAATKTDRLKPVLLYFARRRNVLAG